MLNSFHISVISVAFFILVISFLVIAYKFFMMKKDFVYPPVLPSCPDHWQDLSEKTKGSKCVNVKKLGTCGINVMDFSKPQWIGSKGSCNKKRWATSCGVVWEGITNKNPCEDY
jgi:hypothetical protein